jgi:hypothetical protein
LADVLAAAAGAAWRWDGYAAAFERMLGVFAVMMREEEGTAGLAPGAAKNGG